MNPWKIIGWIVLGGLVLLLAFCGAVVYRVGVNEANRQDIENGTHVPEPSAYSAKVLSFTCEESASGAYTRSEMTIRNTSGQPMSYVRIFVRLGDAVENTYFTPVSIPQDGMASATVMRRGNFPCEVIGAQINGKDVALTK